MITLIRKFLFVIPLLGISIFLQAQDVQTFERGIYLSFEDYLNNSPSRKDFFQIYEENEMAIGRIRNKSDRIVSGTQQMISIYRLKDKDGKRFKGQKDFWGFSDGNNVYINSATHTKADHFVKLQLIGAICYFFQLGNESGLKKQQYYDPGDIRNIHPSLEPKLYYLDQYVINMKNGQIDRLTKEILLRLVSPYADLVATVNTLDKRDIFIDVIRFYNLRMKSEIGNTVNK